MKKILKNYKGVIAFYLLILISVFAISARFDYLNNAAEPVENNIIAYK